MTDNSLEENFPDVLLIGGTYRHFKGGLYKILHLARHSETGGVLVIYQNVDVGGDGGIWARPYAMFIDHVVRLNIAYEGPRFTFVE